MIQTGDLKIDLRSFRDVDAALGELPKAVGRNVLRRTARFALEPLADRAAELAPISSGRLAFSISVSERRTRRASSASTARLVHGNWRSDPTSSIVMAMGPAGGFGVLPYATFVEFGTVDTAPQPFMRPAWDGGKDALLDRVKSRLWFEVQRSAERAARKAARRGGR